MLGKLLKYEWKQTWKLPTAVCLATMAATIIGVISFFTPLWDLESTSSSWLMAIGILFFIMNIVVLIASALSILVYFSIRFYKNLYTDEGYLMHTLPVTSRQLIFSKFWIFFLWFIINGLLLCLCCFALMWAMDCAIYTGFMDTWKELFEIFSKIGLPEIYHQLNLASTELTGLPAWCMGILLLFLWFIAFCHTILTPYFAISIGQLFSKFKLGASIGIYIAIIMLQQLLTTVIMFPINTSLFLSPSFFSGEYHIWQFYVLYAPQYVITILLTVLFYFLTHRIMKKHLNLD